MSTVCCEAGVVLRTTVVDCSLGNRNMYVPLKKAWDFATAIVTTPRDQLEGNEHLQPLNR